MVGAFDKEDRSGEVLASSLGELFDGVAERFSALTAVEFDAEQISYEELKQLSDAFAHHLIRDGVSPGDVVAVCLPRSLELSWVLVGILKAGAAYLPVDEAFPLDRQIYMLKDSCVSHVVTRAGILDESVLKRSKPVLLDGLEKRLLVAGGSGALPVVTQVDTAYVIYTSGSTGKPKGVIMPHSVLLNLMSWHAQQARLGQPSRTLQFTPLGFDVHFQEFYGTWITGGTLVMISEELRLNALALLKFLRRKKVSRLYLPFTALRNLVEVALRVSDRSLIPDHLKDIVTAGEQLSIDDQLGAFLKALTNCVLHNHYGPSETHVVSALLLEGNPDNWPAFPSIGRPINNCVFHVLDDCGRVVEEGGEGELYVGGACVAEGYVGLEGLTKERFITDPCVDSGLIFYRSGDTVKQLPDGNYQFLGRKDGQVKIRGHRVELAEVELALCNNPFVEHAVASLKKFPNGQSSLVAYLKGASGVPESERPATNVLRDYLGDQVPDFMIPGHFMWLDEFPLTPSGKTDRRALPLPEAKRPELDQPYVKPKGEHERQLCTLWEELLQIDRVGVLDNLFDLGADSILCIKSVARLKQEFDLSLPVTTIFQSPTVRALSKHLEGQGGDMKQFAEAAFSAKTDDEDTRIAIIGMAGRFPGANNVGELWEVLRSGAETTSFFAEGELDPAIDVSLRKNPNYVGARGILENAECFDPDFFGISPLEAQVMDPQHRVFLEIAYEACENAGYCPKSYRGKVGVFAGTHNNSYFSSRVSQRPDLVERLGEFQAMVCNEKDYIATRVAHKLNCKGPAVSIHTACSTSLVATVMAVESLLHGGCDMALAGGVSVTVPQRSGHLHQEGAMLSKDGHCRPFDASASGTVFSDGAGVVLLKRYEDARRDGDTIVATIKGAAINNDGSDKMSFSAPSIDGQADVVAEALRKAGITADSVSYVEAHGTATPLGDPIEISGLTTAFRRDSDSNQFCAVGSIKSNFGHLTAASGVAGLIKTALSLFHKEIPPSLHFDQPNPQIDFQASPFYVNTELKVWERADTPRRAGVSSFGVGGTNAHVILEEAVSEPATESQVFGPMECIPFSARSRVALGQMLSDFEHFLDKAPDVQLRDLAFTLQQGREQFRIRQSFVCRDAADLRKQLSKTAAGGNAAIEVSRSEKSVTFLFPGQGAQYKDMGSELYKYEPIFAAAVDSCALILEDLMGEDIRGYLLGSGDSTAEPSEKDQETRYVQPAIFVIEYALARLWMHRGVNPDAMIGHSIGEYVCACIAGVMSLEDSLRLVSARGELMQSMPPGSMLSVRLASSSIDSLIEEGVNIASINAPNLCVVAGADDAIDQFQSRLKASDIASSKLHTSHAFHSPMMDQAVQPFLKLCQTVSFSSPSIPFVSTVTGTWIEDKQAKDPNYWSSQIKHPVLFSQALTTLLESEDQVLLEVGPRTTLATLARQHPAARKDSNVVMSSLVDKPGIHESKAYLTAVGKLWCEGLNVDWSTGSPGNRIPLPTYPFEYKRCWIDLADHSGILGGLNNVGGSENSAQKPSMNNKFMNENETPRIQSLLQEIQQVLEDVSGLDIVGSEAEACFVDLGLDSLTLTQAATLLSKRFGLEVTFRQLIDEFSSGSDLAKYLNEEIPLEAELRTQSSPQAAMSQSVDEIDVLGGSNLRGPQNSPVDGNSSILQSLLTQQISLMQRQLEMVSADMVKPHSASKISGAEEKEFQAREPLRAQNVNNQSETNDYSVSYGSTAPRRPFGAGTRIRVKDPTELNEKQQEFYKDLLERYTAQTAGSKRHTQTHRGHFADPRTVSGFTPVLKEFIYPIVTNRSSGSRLWDIDGNEYVDMLGGFGSNIFGHKAPFIVDAIQEQLANGYEIGPQSPLAGEVAELVCELTGMERASFCNTGSEAVLGAMRLARTVTGNEKIVIFEGAYHGILDEVIVRGGRNFKSMPAAAGVPESAVENILVLQYGNPRSLEIIEAHAGEIAGVLVESVQSRRPDFQPRAFLHDLRQVTLDCDIPLIIDECITGFRIHKRGAQGYYDVQADIASYGKVAGGGLPFGIVAGKKRFMDAFDGGFWEYGDTSVPEVGVTYYAGTFSRHPLALAASRAVLLRMKEEGGTMQTQLNKRSDEFALVLNRYFESIKAPLFLANCGSMMNLTFTQDEPLGELFYSLMRLKGVFIWDARPSFLTASHTDEDIAFLITAIKEAIDEVMNAGIFS